MKNLNKTWKQTVINKIDKKFSLSMRKIALKKQIEIWLNSNDLTIEELEKIIHFCNGGDAIH